MKKLRRNEGYTLTELIIAIAIIALLAAMIAPSIVTKIDKSKESRAIHTCRTTYDAAVTVVVTENADVSTDDTYWGRILELAGTANNADIRIVDIKQDAIGNVTKLTVYDRGKYATFLTNGLGYIVGNTAPVSDDLPSEGTLKAIASETKQAIATENAVAKAETNDATAGTQVAEGTPATAETPVVVETPAVTETPAATPTYTELTPQDVEELYQVPEEGEEQKRYPTSVTTVADKLDTLPTVGTLNANNNKNKTGISDSTLNQEEVDRRITAALTESFGTDQFNYEVQTIDGYRCLIVSVGHKYVKGDSDFSKNNSKKEVAVYIYRYSHESKAYVFYDIQTGKGTLQVANKKGDDGLKFNNIQID